MAAAHWTGPIAGMDKVSSLCDDPSVDTVVVKDMTAHAQLDDDIIANNFCRLANVALGVGSFEVITEEGLHFAGVEEGFDFEGICGAGSIVGSSLVCLSRHGKNCVCKQMPKNEGA